MRKRFRFLLPMFLVLIAAGADAADKGIHVNFGALPLMSSTKQGGQGPSGSTLLTQSELAYHWENIGLGFFFQYDKQGANEVDSGYGPKLEVHLGEFFFDVGYGILAQRAFTDRSVANQKGTSMYFGAGARLRFGKGGGGKGGGFFAHASFKYRTMTIKEQDGIVLDEPITQTDGYPIAGVGYIF